MLAFSFLISKAVYKAARGHLSSTLGCSCSAIQSWLGPGEGPRGGSTTCFELVTPGPCTAYWKATTGHDCSLWSNKRQSCVGRNRNAPTMASCATGFAPWQGCWEPCEEHSSPQAQALGRWPCQFWTWCPHYLCIYLIFYHGATGKELFNTIINKSSTQLSAFLFHFKFTISLLLLWQE